MDSVRRIADAAEKLPFAVVVNALVDDVMTEEEYRRGAVREKVTKTIFQNHLEQLIAIATPQDTVIIYTHSHGRKGDFETSQPFGGIVLDLPVRRTKHRGTFLWPDYAERLLRIPAKNIVVLTMSCYSGGLVEYLNMPDVKSRWENKWKKENRNLIVLASQSKDLMSRPIVKDGEVINPFTYAVAKAFEGEADGFSLTQGKPDKRQPKDGNLTLGEITDYILYATENTLSESARFNNTAKPQLTGHFDRAAVLGGVPLSAWGNGSNHKRGE